MTDNTQNDQDNTPSDQQSTENIEIFSTDDEKIKSIGELLTNDSSRKILQLLFKEELTATQLAQKTETSLQLVKYHLNKMQDMGVVKVSKIEKNIKAQDMKYYKATKFAIVILPSAVSDKAKESKLLIRSFKTIYRFVGIGVAGVASWFATRTLQQPREFSLRSNSDEQLTPTGEPPQLEPIEPQHGAGVPSEPSPPTVAEPEESRESFQSGEEQAPADTGSADYSDWSSSSEVTADTTLEESLEFTERQIEAEPTAGSGTPLITPDAAAIPDVFLQFLVPIVVVAVGLIIELYLRYRKKRIEQRSMTR